MDRIENKPMDEIRTKAKKILDFFVGFLGSLLVGNIGIVLIAQFDTPERMWISYFTWVWRFAFAVLAVFFLTRNRIWNAIGIVAAILLQAVGI